MTDKRRQVLYQICELFCMRQGQIGQARSLIETLQLQVRAVLDLQTAQLLEG